MERQPPLTLMPLIISCSTRAQPCTDGLNFAAHDTYTQDTKLANQRVDYAASGLGARTDVPSPSPFAPAPAGPVTTTAPAT